MKSRARFVSGLAALAALFLAPLAEASLTRSSAPARETTGLSLSLAAPEPSEFSLFDGTEIARALASRPAFDLISITTDETSTAARTRFVSSSELSADELPNDAPELLPITSVREQRFNLQIPPDVFGLEPLRGPPGDEASYPKTRYRVFELLGTPILGELRGASLELRWRSASFSCGLASGTVGWLSQDPLGDKDSPNLYGFVGARPHEKTDPLGLGAETVCLENPMFCAGVVQGVKDLFWGIVTAPARLMERDYQETVAKARAYNRGGVAERQRVAQEFGKEHNAALVEMAPVVGTARRIGEAWEECAHSGASFECGEKLVPAGAGVVTDATLVYGLTSKAAQLSRAGESASVAGSAPRAAAMDAVAGSEFADDALRMTEQPFAPRKSGETIYTRAGRLAHAEVPLPPGFKRRVRLPSGKEMDAYNPDTREVIEIKPNTRRQIRRGEKQVGGYCAECDVEKGPGHTGRVLPYDPAPFLDRIKGEEP